MDLRRLGHILWRWRWLVLAVNLVTLLLLGLRLREAAPVYEGQAKVQLAAPQAEQVALFGDAGAANLREEFAVARNDFIDVLQAPEVHGRTATRLGLQGQAADYTVDVSPVRDTDFITVRIGARTPELAAQLANTHVAAAIGYFGELRAKPAAATKTYLAGQLQTAAEAFYAAENAIAEAHAQNRGTDLQEENLRQARDQYKLVLSKYTEATLKESRSLDAASLIQVVEPATAPAQSTSRQTAGLLGVALVGSLGLSALAALLADIMAGGRGDDPSLRSFGAAADSSGRVVARGRPGYGDVWTGGVPDPDHELGPDQLVAPSKQGSGGGPRRSA